VAELALATLGSVWANPNGMTVVKGTAQTTQTGTHLQVNISDNAFLDWRSFNISSGESTRFQQPGPASIVWNRIMSGDPSTIFGSLQANGVVVLANSAGFYFGPTAFVQAAGMIVTTATVTPSMIGTGPLDFSGPPPGIPIVNYGRLQTESGGSVFLIAKQVENHGTIDAPGGTVGLLAGQEVLVSTRPDGLGLAARVRLPEGSVDNAGRIVADAGQILIEANTVNQRGRLEANALQERNGVIELVAADRVQLGAESRIEAQGGSVGSGGSIVIKSDRLFQDEPGSEIRASGGTQRGDGGQIEISAPELQTLSSRLDAAASPGFRPGRLFLDPTDITLSTTGSGSAGSGAVGANDPPSNLSLNVNSAFSGFSQITLQATHNITLAQGTTWDLAASTGQDQPSCQLTLQAANDIQLQGGSRLLGGNNWSISLTAGADLSSGQGAVARVGNVTLNGDATIEAGLGKVSVLAGNSIQVGSGAIRTTGGGAILAQAVAGNVDCGSNPAGLLFTTSSPGYQVDPGCGGISTLGGGDVSIQAGKDVLSFLPSATGLGRTSDAGAGAFGAQPGNLTIEAGGNVSGHYLVRNGTGTINCSGNAGTASRVLALSLVKGSWSVMASDSIDLLEVRNPNGVFNAQAINNPMRFLFDYDPQASVSLKAGNGVTLSGGLLPRPGAGAQIPVILPPVLTIEAGSGGVTLGNNLTLFPSPFGNLSISTTDGGALSSTVAGAARYVTISDSDKKQWKGPTDFTAGDQGNNVLHLNDPEPAVINIAGSVSDFFLVSSKPVNMQVSGDIHNSSVAAQNLRPTDRTVISAGGQILNRNYYTFLILPSAVADPQMDVLQYVQGGAELANRFIYDPATRRLGFAGRMTQQERDALLNIQIPDPSDPLQQRLIPATFVDPTMIAQLYAMSQDVPIGPLPGYSIAGPGALNISAATLDLGLSQGIRSLGIANNAELYPYTKRGADINITLRGDLEMFSSSIISEYGGKIQIQSDGAINVGSQEQLGLSELPRGIVSLWGGDIDVVARGNVEVNGSRIAAYDGGNIHVESLDGNVNAGEGGSGFVRVDKPYFDPQTGEVEHARATIPGSGILATSYPIDIPGQPPSGIGNIAVETPHGDILASHGGIVQVALGSASSRNSSITLTAGSTDADGTVHVGKIVATGSGVIGGNVDMKATGDIEGVVVAQADLSIASRQNVSVTAVGQGSVNISASGTVSGTVVGVGAVNVSGQSISANMVSTTVNASGEVSAPASTAQAAAPPPSTAGQVSTREAESATQTESTAPAGRLEEENAKRRKAGPQIQRTRGRVRVILP
jgi:filamentous hemagglutinin family protein